MNQNIELDQTSNQTLNGVNIFYLLRIFFRYKYLIIGLPLLLSFLIYFMLPARQLNTFHNYNIVIDRNSPIYLNYVEHLKEIYISDSQSVEKSTFKELLNITFHDEEFLSLFIKDNIKMNYGELLDKVIVLQDETGLNVEDTTNITLFTIIVPYNINGNIKENVKEIPIIANKVFKRLVTNELKNKLRASKSDLDYQIFALLNEKKEIQNKESGNDTYQILKYKFELDLINLDFKKEYDIFLLNINKSKIEGEILKIKELRQKIIPSIPKTIAEKKETAQNSIQMITDKNIPEGFKKTEIFLNLQYEYDLNLKKINFLKDNKNVQTGNYDDLLYLEKSLNDLKVKISHLDGEFKTSENLINPTYVVHKNEIRIVNGLNIFLSIFIFFTLLFMMWIITYLYVGYKKIYK